MENVYFLSHIWNSIDFIYFQIIYFYFTLRLFTPCFSIRPDENSKDLPNSINNEDYLRKRKRPLFTPGPGYGNPSGYPSGCKFGPKPGVYKTDGQGRTFFDLAFLNVGYNQQYNINCGNIGQGGHIPDSGTNQHQGGFKPGAHKPGGFQHGGHRPGGHRPGGHGGLGGNGGHGGLRRYFLIFGNYWGYENYEILSWFKRYLSFFIYII